jgi:hypothetical protein
MIKKSYTKNRDSCRVTFVLTPYIPVRSTASATCWTTYAGKTTGEPMITCQILSVPRTAW